MKCLFNIEGIQGHQELQQGQETFSQGLSGKNFLNFSVQNGTFLFTLCF